MQGKCRHHFHPRKTGENSSTMTFFWGGMKSGLTSAFNKNEGLVWKHVENGFLPLVCPLQMLFFNLNQGVVKKDVDLKDQSCCATKPSLYIGRNVVAMI